MSETPPRNGGLPQRDANGRVTGGSLRKASKLNNARGLAKKLRAEAKRRFGSAEKLYFFYLDIAQNAAEKGADRIRAIEKYAERMDGKTVQAIELQMSGPDGGPVQTESTTRHDLAAPDRLAAVASVLRAAGALPSGGGPGDAGGGAPPAE